MKYRLLSLLIACCLAIPGFSVVNYALNESFENGIPATWSQEGATANPGGAWILDTLSTNPTGAYDGTHRVALRNLEGSFGYSVRLVTPALDLSAVSGPVLSFAYAQPRQSGFSDTLAVYFRPSADDAWIMIRKYENYQGSWSLQTLDLPAACCTPTCQLAFEANQHGGWGVVLDAVRVYPHSQCLDAEITGFVIGSNAALINWAPRAGRAFELVVSPTALANLSAIDDEAVIFHNSAISSVSQLVSGLSTEAQYYVYLRTDCDDNESGHTSWIDTTFTTTLGIPYTTSLAAIPSAWEQKKGNVSSSVDASTLTDNTGSYKWQITSNTAVFGAAHAYAQSYGTPSWLITKPLFITPEDADASVLLSFKLALTNTVSSTAVSASAATAKFHILVSAEDGEAWTLVRTIEGSEISNTGSLYNILLDDFKDAGNVRLAFVADAQATSAYFHMANLSIAESDGLCLGISGLKPSVTENSISLSWFKVGRSATEVTLSDDAYFSNILQQQIVTGTSHTFSGLESSVTYFIKVRQDCAEGDSLVAQLKTPCPPTTITSESPYVEGFEDTKYAGKAYNVTDGVSPDCWLVYADGSVLPHVVDATAGGRAAKAKAYKHDGTQAMSFYGDGNCYAVLPGFTNALNTLKISFWMQTESNSEGTLTLGYITDGDLNFNTFHAITTYANNQGQMIQRTTDLSELPDDATNLVFRWYISGKSSVCGIDDIELRLLPQCRKVKGVAVTPGAVASELTFIDHGAPEYDVLVTTKRLNPDTLQTTRFTVFRDTVTNDTVAITGLAATTTFYAYVRSICEGQEEAVDWSDVASFTTPCAMVSIAQEAFSENFNTLTSGIPNCWDNSEGTTTSTDYQWKYYATGHEGAGLRFDSYLNSSGNTNILATPSIDLLRDATLSFWLKNPTGGDCEILISTDGGATKETLMSGLTGISTWTFYEINLSSYTGSEAIIYFKGTSNYGNGDAYIYLDEVLIEAIPTCHKMGTVSLAGVTSNSATLRYEATNAQQYQVVLATKSINPAKANLASDTIVYNQLISTTTPAISGLNGNTRYYAYVRGYCGDDDYSTWSDEFSFKTLCTAMTPEAFGLETFNEAGSADCWTFGFKTNGSSSSNAYTQRTSENSYGGYIKLSKESVGSKNGAGVDTVYNDGAYAITPELDVEDISTYQVSFDAATISQVATNYKKLNVGIIVDPTDLSTAEVIKTIELDYAADSAAVKSYSVSFAGYEGDYMGQFGKFVIFELKEAAKHDSTNFVLIDNVTIEPVATCAQVIEAQIDSIEGIWAAISWENTGAGEYEVLLSQLNTRRPDTISAPLSMDTIADHHIIFTGLTDNTLYYAYVRSICGEGDTAKWSNAIRFHTTQTPVLPPFTDDFEEGNTWLFVNGEANTWEWGTATNHGGTHALYISQDGGATNTYNTGSTTTVFATRTIKIPESGVYSFSFDWQANGESTYDYLRVALAPATEEFTSGEMPSGLGTSVTPDTWIALDGGAKLNLDTTWHNESRDITVDAGIYKVVFVWRNDGSQGNNPPAAIDNFHFARVHCAKPLNLQASLTPGNGSIATISWNKGDADSWILEYTTDSLFTNAKDTTLNDTVVNLTGLTPETLHRVRVKALCGEEAESEWSQELTFIPTNAYSLLVNNGSATSSYVPVYGMYVDHLSYSQFVIPESQLTSIELSSINQLTFYSSIESLAWGNPVFEVYMTTIEDTTITSLVEWASMTKVMNARVLSVANNQMVVTLDMPFDYEGGSLLIGFKQTVESTTWKSSSWYGVSASNAALYGYDSNSATKHSFTPKMLIDYIPGDAPTCPRVRGIVVEDILTDSARLVLPDLDVDGYHIILTTASVSINALTASDSAKIVFNDSIFSQSELQLFDLNAATPYYVYARATCNGEHGMWASPVVFQTACDLISDLPYIMNFENVEVGSLPICWNLASSSSSASTYPAVIASSTYVHGGSNAFAWGLSSTETVPAVTWVSLPPMEDSISHLQMTFWYRSASYEYECDSLIVGVMTDPSDTTTFVPVQGFHPQSTTYAQAEVNFDTYAGDGQYIAFKRVLVGEEDYDYDYGYYTVYTPFIIDDVKVNVIPTCLPVTGIVVDNIGQDSARISFRNAEAVSYDVVVASEQLDMYHLSHADSAKIAFSANGYADTTVVANGLNASTAYYVYVRTNCADNSSEWSNPEAFFTACGAIVVSADAPWTEDFELYPGSSYSVYNNDLNCWLMGGTTTVKPHVANSGSFGYYVHSGTKTLSFYGSASSVSYAALPLFDGALNGLQINFWARMESSTVGSLSLGYILSNDPGDFSTFVAVETYDNVTTMTQYEGDLSVLPAAASRLVFRWEYTGSSYYTASVDDITISLLPACRAVKNLNASAITTSSANISFALAPSPEYDFVVTTAAINPDTLVQVADSIIFRHDTVAVDTVALIGLSPTTDYYVYLRALCSETETSAWANAHFVTPCLAAVPYVENFDDANNRKVIYSTSSSTYTIPSCWNETYESSSYISTIQQNGSSTYAYSGNSALRLYSSSSYGSYLVLPEMDASLDTLQLTFKARAMYMGSSSYTNYASSTYAHSVKVGTLTDPNDFSTFQLLDTYVLDEVASPASSDNYWEDVTIYLQGATGKYITIVTAFDKSNYVWIDDVEVSRAPNCIAPSAIAVTAGTTTADVTWSSVATGFEVALGHAGFALPDGADTIYSVSDAMNLHMEDLAPSTNYDLYIRAYCEEGLASSWSRVASFMTGCLVPFEDDFEGSDHWTFINGSQTNAWAHGTAASNGGSSAMYISNDGGASNAYTVSATSVAYAVKTFTFDEDGGYIFSYDWLAYGESSSDYLRVALAPADTKLTAGTKVSGISTTALPTGWIALDGGSKLNLSSAWTSFTSDEITLTAGNYMVVFAWINDYSLGTQVPAAIDNFSISKMACSTPVAPTVAQITTSSAVIRWEIVAESYEIALISATDTVYRTVTGSDSLLLEDLYSSSAYFVKMRVTCEEEAVSNWSEQVGFVTPCPAEVVSRKGWSEYFDELSGGIPACWNNSEGTTTSDSHKWTYYSTGHEGAGLRFNSYMNTSGNTNILATPALELTAASQLTFWWKNPTGGAGEVLISTDGGATKTSLLSGLTSISDWTQYEMDLTAYTGQTVIIYFKGTSNYGNGDAYLYLDDIEVMPYDACRAVKDLSITNISADGATVNFSFADGEVHGAHVAISREAAFDYSTAMLVDTIMDTTYVFNVALQDKVTYYVYVRMACDDDEVSAWKSTTFVTPYVLRYEAEFESTTLSSEWSRYTGLLNNVLAGTTVLTSTTSGWSLVDASTAINGIHFKGNIYGTDWKYWVVSPLISLGAPAGSAVLMRFDAAYNKWNQLTTDPDQDGNDDRFAVLVTTDDGATWTKVTEWNNAGTGDYVLREVPKEGKTYNVNLSSFIGQTVRIAFYGESTASNADNDFHFGNIVINQSIHQAYEKTICDGSDYVGADYGNAFEITPDDYQTGDNYYELYRPALNGSGLPDTLQTLNLTVMGTETYEDSVVLCEGEHFSQIINGGNFDFIASVGMQDQVRFVQSEFGCRNIVRLKITVNPKVTEHIYDSVALGEQYKWHGEIYISATDAQFDTVSLVTGCDSTVYLHLTVYQKEEALHGVHAQDLLIAPNPVHVGEPIHVLNDFVAAELEDARIEIYSNTGALYYVQHGADQPFILPAIQVSGMYHVRILVGDEIYLSTLLVQ